MNASFTDEVNASATLPGYRVLILFYRSGGRSENCLVDFDMSLFDAVHEIDQPRFHTYHQLF